MLLTTHQGPAHNQTIQLCIEQLRNFVPIDVLSDSHLVTLARVAARSVFAQGQTIATDLEAEDNLYFLLSGQVNIVNANKHSHVVTAGSEESHLALGDGDKSVAAMVALSDCHVLSIGRKQLEGMLCWDQAAKALALDFSARRQFDEDADWMNMLLASNLFHKIPPYNVSQIFDQFQPRVVQAGETIIRQGEDGDSCYVIKEGMAIVTQCETEDCAPLIVAELAAGHCFGEDALLNKSQRNATVIMETNGVLMELHKQDFFALMVEPKVPATSYRDAVASIDNGAQWLDVRSEQEYENRHFDNAFHLPMHLMTLKSRMMDSSVRYIAYCSSGKRASTAAYLLAIKGFDVVPLEGACFASA